jgi:hypothetical protein
MRLAEDPPMKFSLTGTGRGGGPLELKIKNNKIKITKLIAPEMWRTEYIFYDGDRSGRGAAWAQN